MRSKFCRQHRGNQVGSNKLIDLTGRRFGRLIALSMVAPADGSPHLRWLCACDCGNTKVIIGYALRWGLSQSCGCLRRLVLAKIKTKHGKNRGNSHDLAWRRKVKQRDNHTCQVCGKTNLSGLEEHAHHKLPVRVFPELRYDVDNGQTLCSSCHPKETKKEMVIYG
jgi:5-methylcytosine-specific restriction endonuclease McrA